MWWGHSLRDSDLSTDPWGDGNTQKSNWNNPSARGEAGLLLQMVVTWLGGQSHTTTPHPYLQLPALTWFCPSSTMVPEPWRGWPRCSLYFSHSIKGLHPQDVLSISPFPARGSWWVFGVFLPLENTSEGKEENRNQKCTKQMQSAVVNWQWTQIQSRLLPW